MTASYLIYTVIFMAFLFDFVNGCHDAPNSVATLVTTGTLKPILAVLWAAFFNFIAFLFFHLHIANTIGSGLIHPGMITPYLILAALIGAISFNIFTWYLALPSSSSHALIGGLIGAAVATNGWKSVEFVGLSKILLAIIISPILGMIVCVLLFRLVHGLLPASPDQKNLQWYKRFQLLSAALLSLGHGGNDAQKTMGIIALVLFSSHLLGPHFYVPWWVVITCNLVMRLGTLSGGWRIVRTLGTKITKLDPMNGSIAETSSAMILFVSTYLGLPVSTTHIVTGAISGAGVKKGGSQINWKVLRKIMLAWLITIPGAGLVAAMLIYLKAGW